MQTEDRVLNDRRQGQEVEQLSELLPHIGIPVLAKALIIEAIAVIEGKERSEKMCAGVVLSEDLHLHLCDLPTFMVAAEDRDPIWEADLERH